MKTCEKCGVEIASFADWQGHVCRNSASAFGATNYQQQAIADRPAKRAKRKPGRPVSTGSADTPMVQFRVSRDERKAIAERAKRLDETVNQYAKRRTLAQGDEP